MTKLSRKRKLLFLTLVFMLGLLSVEIYTAIYPREAFYRAEFERIAGTEFPNSAQFIFKEASFPDHFGDYVSCAVFAVDEADYVRLSQRLERHRLQHGSNNVGSDCLKNLVEAHGGPLKFRRQTSAGYGGGEYRHWGLLDDGQSVMFHYVSW